MASAQLSADDLVGLAPDSSAVGESGRHRLRERAEPGVLVGATAVLYLWARGTARF